MCCIKVLGSVEIIFKKEVMKQFKGTPITMKLATHDGLPVGLVNYNIKLWYDTIKISFDKPKEGCCKKE